ncbi:hypothetical protein SLS62_001753 [Diatrype stigma]|uniref:Uncharacterized protein n=1 Tax=Diatrype stigma TaxID=117547 RepID=A0AAN9UYC2_9PEZI
MTSTTWNLPKVSAGISVSDPVVVVFLTPVSPAERDALFADINNPEDEASWPDRPPVAHSRSLAHIPWMRNFTPTTAQTVYDILRVSGTGDVIFVDEQTMRERAAGALGSVVVANSDGGMGGAAAAAAQKGPTEQGVVPCAARVGIRRAKAIISSVLDSKQPPQSRRTATAGSASPQDDSRETKSLRDVMPDYEACKLDLSGPQAVRAQDRESRPEDEAGRPVFSEESEYVYIPPAHLPVDLGLTYEEPTLVSLVHLEDSEMDQLRSSILEGVARTRHVHGESSLPEHVRIFNWPSDREPGTWSEMHRIFSAIRPPIWEGHGRNSDASALFVDNPEHDDTNPGEVQVLLVHQTRCPDSQLPDTNLQVAKLNKIEFTLDTWHAMFNLPDPSAYGPRFSTNYVSCMRYLPDPDRLVVSGDEAIQCNVFILCPVSEAGTHQIRGQLGRYHEVQLWDVSHLVTTADLGGFIKLLESAEFRRYNDPLSYFVAMDQTTLDSLDSCIIAERATNYYVDEHGRDIGADDLGYGWGRVDYELALDMWVNYSCANMSLKEDLEDRIQYVYWSHISEDEVRSAAFTKEAALTYAKALQVKVN